MAENGGCAASVQRFHETRRVLVRSQDTAFLVSNLIVKEDDHV